MSKKPVKDKAAEHDSVAAPKPVSPAQIREARLRAKLEADKPAPTSGDEHHEAFRQFFAKARHKLKLKRELENPVWLHLKAVGMANPDKFEDGLRNFGFKL
jgi:hypothetical protein